MLASNLSNNGILVIFNSNYLFDDTDISKDFEKLIIKAETNTEFVHKFSKAGIRLKTININEIIVYRKTSN